MKNWFAKKKSSAADPQGAPAPSAAVATRKEGGTAGMKGPRGSRKAPKRARSRGGLAPVLGLYVTQQTIYGLLLRRDGDAFEVVRRVTRKRAADHGESSNSPEELLAESAVDDIAIQFGDAGITGVDMFVGGEFGGLAGASETSLGEESIDMSTAMVQPIVLELKDLIEECRSSGADSPRLAFCLDNSDVAYAELRVEAGSKSKSLFSFGKGGEEKDADKENEKAAKRADSVKRETLLELLPDQVKAYGTDAERIAFLPMTPRDGAARFLAIVPTPSDPVTPSVGLLREQDGMRNVRMTLLSAEIPALMGLTRQVFPMGTRGNTAIVRVGAEDTLVMLLVDDMLHHAEHMRSVTTFDGPDTICSRVLLQQDVQGVGNVDQVIVLAEEREEELVNGFAAFYPDAHVTTLRQGLVEGGWLGAKAAAQRPLATMLLPAASVALDTFHKGSDSGFPGVNLFPKALLRQKMKFEWLSNFGFAWHTVLAAAVMFMAVLFFTSVYFKNEAVKSDLELQIATFPASNLSPEQIQFRIDSLNAEVARINMTLNAIDSLLIGSDRWSKGLAQTARATSTARRSWLQSWSEEGGSLVMSGRATSRQGVVEFADQMGGSIESVRFSEIREVPAYDFEIRSVLTYEMPEVALYLRENAQGFDAPAPVPVAEPLASYDEAPFEGDAPAASQAPPESAPPPPAPAAPPADAHVAEEAPPDGVVVPELPLEDGHYASA
ncbi:MAG: hypothetical protein AAF624_16740, partial [Bacteroidota bacterium]